MEQMEDEQPSAEKYSGIGNFNIEEPDEEMTELLRQRTLLKIQKFHLE